ncbi:zinc finger lsd1 subclass family protein (macronuclear) [Tetrahymena thermophila SB210]|uniref:Zinc finger lsd1 subclass family protein n=1 Tax=Tetrahymena thermophila (strain SB210) TaxID=312017 RepID=Q24FT6_TETTS|nr:zinc finger lsd1 subclass family protein [Tetrahymena thermophila SB210]EAS06674.2 zinc finger lsd1 subclass family protein [Tetrahymena thermophila SB210]|eukprot:XP_001026919.2 zinc finger lsd1 subclass family protein [Tetrahymena thermophila SB210]
MVFGAEKLQFEELNSQFTLDDVQWFSNNVTTCLLTDFTEYSQKNVLGIFGLGHNTTSKTFQNLPPHWSISIRFDLLLYRSLDPNDYIYVDINGEINTYQKQGPRTGYQICRPEPAPPIRETYPDELVLYQKTFTHSNSSIKVSVESKTDEVIDNEGFGLRYFYLYLDTCHDSCLTCNGPTENDCLECPEHSNKNGTKCTCDLGYYAQNNSCTKNCENGYKQDITGQLCVQDFCHKDKCELCQNGQCIQCDSDYYLLNGQCVTSCPSYSTLNGQQCVDLISQTSHGRYLLKSMFDTHFGESEIKRAGITALGFLGYNKISSGALTTVCGGMTILGGAYLSSAKSSISKTFSRLEPHWSVAIGYTLYKIDQWNNESVQLIVNSNIIETTTRNRNDGDSNICGRIQYNDQIIYVSKNFTHSETDLILEIKSNLNNNPFESSYGIRELYILVDYCTSFCEKCNAEGCSKCKSDYYLYDFQCLEKCPEGFFNQKQVDNNICQQCDSSCKSCDGPNSNNCLSCQAPNLFYQQNLKTCVENCNSDQFKNKNDQICSSCDPSCTTCAGPSSTDCLSCSGDLFLFQNQCIQNCPDQYYNNVQNNQCMPCDPTCYTCNGSASNNCLSCSQKTFLDPNSNKCVSQCSLNYYPDENSNQCRPCYTTCQECNGPSESDCLTCKQGLVFQDNQCIKKCKDSYYENLNHICQKCDSSCQTCTGPSESECTSCPSNLLFFKNYCLSECPIGYYSFKKNQNFQCFECAKYCQLGCSGPFKMDCDQIKYKYQIILFIFVGIIFLWIASSIIGYLLDKKQSKIFNSIINNPCFPDKQENISKISVKKLKKGDSQQYIQDQNKQQNENEKQSYQKQNHLEKDCTLNFLEQIMQHYQKTKEVIPRSDIKNSQKCIQVLESQKNLESDQLSLTKISKMCIQTTTDNILNFDHTNNQTDLNPQGQNDNSSQQYKYTANQKLKYLLLGNEWISLFYFYDSEFTRVARAILIFLKYQAFFLSSELVYYNSEYLLIIALIISLLFKQALKSIQSILLKKSVKLLSVILVTSIISLSLYIAFWFAPQIQNMYHQKDKTWSIYYGQLLIWDFLILQQVLSFVEYIFTIKYLNALQCKNKFVKVYKLLSNKYFIQKIK